MWGKETVINLYQCDSVTKEKIKRYSEEICKLIDMREYGKPIIQYFGNAFTEGYTLIQLIETSSIVGHFAEKTNSAYINIFSCKPYDDDSATIFTQKYFGANNMEVVILKRK